MSHWNGRHGRGAAREARELRRVEAAERDADFEARIARIEREQNTTRATAYHVAASEPRMRQAKARARADYAAGYEAYVLAHRPPFRPSRAWSRGWEDARLIEVGELSPDASMTLGDLS